LVSFPSLLQGQVIGPTIVSPAAVVAVIFSKDGMKRRGIVPAEAEKTRKQKAPAVLAGALRRENRLGQISSSG
jgi:hypothetical protein